MDTLAIIIIAGLVTIVILVLIARNTILSNRITDTAVENDRLKRENRSLEKENNELNDELDQVAGGGLPIHPPIRGGGSVIPTQRPTQRPTKTDFHMK